MRRLSILALASALIASPSFAQSVPTKPGDHGLFDGGAYPPEASGFVTTVNLGTALSGYAKTSDLQNYLPLTGGTMTGNVQMQGHLVMNGGNYISFSTNGHLQYFDNTDSLLMEISAGDGNPAAVKVYTPIFNTGAPTSNPGSGSHYICVDDAGEMFRSDTACVQ